MPTKTFIHSAPLTRPSFAAWPHFPEDEIEAAAKPLRSGKVNYWTGAEGRLFEQEFADYIECNHAIALANGTSALELALYSLGIGPGDEVIVPSRTFIASASCAVVRGATPVIVDIHPESQNLTAENIEAALTSRTKAIIAVHLAGWPCEMDSILKLAKEYDLKVIEDCAQAHGAEYEGRKVGSFGDMAAFSFCQDKIMTTGGEGGMLVTDNEELWEKAWSYKDHGKSYDTVHKKEHPSGFRWLHESFGTNWRLTEMQSAIGRVQLRKLDGWVGKRRKFAGILNERLSRLQALNVTIPPLYISHAYYKYYTFIRPEYLKNDWDRDRIMGAINEAGIPCHSGSCSEIYLEEAFTEAELGPKERLPVAQHLGETSLMFMVHPTLNEQNIHDTCDVIEKVLERAIN